MMGTGPFAVPTFRGLYQTHHAIVALVTSPLRTHRGKRVAPISPIRDVAHQHGTEIFDPETINSDESIARLQRFAADLLVVCDYGQILSTRALATARFGGINLHGSLLPKYRGAAPINWAVYNDEKKTGITVIHMTPKVDAGPCIAQASMPIEPDETADELEPRLAQMGEWLVRRAIDSVESGRLEALPQDPALASRAPRLKKSDGLIDWTRPAEAIRNHVRAMDPWPKTYTFWHRPRGQPMRLIPGPLTVVEATEAPVTAETGPGTVLQAAGERLVVATGEGAVQFREIQPAGKRPMGVEQFLRGNRVLPGDHFGPQ
ncbi:MAG: methionyl-tRNA formyltransferase [Thermoguttaceae bacterium]